MKCQNCGTEIKGKVKFCSKCGTKVEEIPIRHISTIGSFPHDISTIWPEWMLEKQLGKGSYGVVYQAVRKDNNVESHAAIKVISIPSDVSEVDSLRSEGLDMDGTRTYFKGVVDDFVSEIQLMESLKGIQNIVSVEDYKVVEKTTGIGWDIYIRMELLTPFNTYICDKTLTEAEIIKLGCDICTALEICGQRNIIHRDIKPENIFVNDFGYFKLGDFGIARKLENMTGGLSQKGTFNYMAPEVANSNDYDSRVDTYSLGIVLYRLLNNNKLPFLDTDKQLLNPNERKNAIERRMRGEELQAPCNASPAMANLILRACAYDPNIRFASATDMKQALISVTNGTYKMIDAGLDKTTSVRPAQVNCDATTAVRKAAGSSNQNSQPVVNTFGNTKRKLRKGKKAKVFAISVLAAIVAIAIALAVMFFSSSAYSVYQDMNSEDFDSALTNYRSDIKDSLIQETLLNMLLKDRVNEVSTGYENGEIDYKSAIAELSALYEMGFDGAKEKIDEIKASNDATNALAKADEYYENGDFENAISEYSKISKTNENYNEAQAKLNEICPKYISSVVETANEYNSNQKYKEAIEYIDTAYNILPEGSDKSELDKVKNESLAFYKTQVSNEVTELTDNSKWPEAFDQIDESIAFNDDEYFKDLRKTTEQKYVDSITVTVEKYMDNKNYDMALKTVNKAHTILPDNSDLKQLQTKVQNETPTYLVDVLQPYESNDFELFSNGESVMMGGMERNNGFMLNVYGWNGQSCAIYNLNTNYTNIEGLIGYVDGRTGDGNTYDVYIYVDDKLVSTIVVSPGKLPQEFSVDLTGATKLEFRTDDACGFKGYIGFAELEIS